MRSRGFALERLRLFGSGERSISEEIGTLCGIVGIYNPRAKQPVDPSLLERMAESLRHRGPDEKASMLKGMLVSGTAG